MLNHREASERDLIDEMEVEMRNPRSIILELDAATALSLVGTIQLALKHPQFGSSRTSHCARHAREIKDKLAVALGEFGPALAEAVRRGNEA